MPTTSQWLAFVLASALFIQVPGPSVLFTIGRALTVGRRDALLSVAGNALGVTTQVMATAVGLGAVVAASAHVYTVLKLAGAAYVVWLGVQAIRHRGEARSALASVGVPVPRASVLRSLRVGFLVGVTNPKTVVFFVAFLPQFVNDRAGHTGLQLAVLGLLFGGMCVVSDSVWALVAARARAWFGRRPQRLDGISVAGGVMMIGLGATMVATE